MESTIVSVSWLHERRVDSGVLSVDVRPPAFYLQGHIPGAVTLPAFYLSGPEGLPERDGFERRLGALGVRGSAHVVAYDDGGSAAAARLFWVLQSFGHERVSVLDGGITAWARAGLALENAQPPRAPVPYVAPGIAPSFLARTEDVLAALGDPDTALVDARSPAEYLGLQAGAARDGHVPGAVNIDAAANFVRGEDGILRHMASEELRALYETADITPDKRVIVYCQSGSRSSETYMVLRSLGYERVFNYAAGWQEWGNRADTPVETS